MKSIAEKKHIIKKNIVFQKCVASGIIIFTLATGIWGFNKNVNKNEKAEIPETGIESSDIIDSQEHLYYDGKYLEHLGNINEENYDQMFIDICRNVKFIYNSNEYKGAAIYIIKYDDDTIHLIDVNNIEYDLLTGELINAKRVKFIPFKESSIFYELYRTGIINGPNIQLTVEYQGYVTSWDGHKHNQTPDMAAEQYADTEYQKKYGGK